MDGDTIATVQVVFTAGVGGRAATSFLELPRLLGLEQRVIAGMARSNMISNASPSFCKALLAFLVQPPGQRGQRRPAFPLKSPTLPKTQTWSLEHL